MFIVESGCLVGLVVPGHHLTVGAPAVHRRGLQIYFTCREGLVGAEVSPGSEDRALGGGVREVPFLWWGRGVEGVPHRVAERAANAMRLPHIR